MYLAPELTLVIAAIVLSLVDLLLPGRVSRTLLGWLALLGIAISAGFVLYFMQMEQDAQTAIQLLNHSYRVDDFANLFKLLFLGGTALVIAMSLGALKREGIEHQGEYYYLFLPATLGAMVMASSGDLITLYVGLELLSITSYILVAIRKHNKQSNEAAFKYVVTGGIASAFILYGMSFMYGLTGSTNLGEINQGLLALDPAFGSMVYLSFFLLIAGLGGKIAVAPFHAWAPDVYQGASTPVTAYLAIVSKAAGLAIIFRLIYNVYFGVGDPLNMPIYQDVLLTLLVLAAAAMILGNAAALRQKNMKRLLAYSGIANAGYLLVPLGLVLDQMHADNFAAMFFYLVAYALMNIGMFAVIMVVSHASGHEQMSGFAGLYHRAPALAWATVILIVSLAGLPISGGFFGKIFIMMGAVRVQAYWLAAIMIVTSTVSFYYYFSIIRQMFLRSGHEEERVHITPAWQFIIWFSAAFSVLLGVFPNLLLNQLNQVFSYLKDLFIIIA